MRLSVVDKNPGAENLTALPGRSLPCDGGQDGPPGRRSPACDTRRQAIAPVSGGLGQGGRRFVGPRPAPGRAAGVGARSHGFAAGRRA